MHELVHGTIATGASSFRPGRDVTPPSDTSSFELSPTSPDNSQTVSIDPFLLEEDEAIVSSLNAHPLNPDHLVPC